MCESLGEADRRDKLHLLKSAFAGSDNCALCNLPGSHDAVHSGAAERFQCLSTKRLEPGTSHSFPYLLIG
jgi:hypothetical protein